MMTRFKEPGFWIGLTLILAFAACETAPPFTVKTVEAFIDGTRGRILVATDKSTCTPDFISSRGSVRAVYAAKPGDQFECQWKPSPPAEDPKGAGR
jgi:hypothetical protein